MNIIRSNIRLAIDGGTPVIDRPLTPYNTIGSDESEAIKSVMSEGCLSGFIGAWGDGFSGGEKVEEFEKMWQDRFGIKNAIFLNSNTSGLIAALGAIGLTPGDEVIVPPTTMSATVMAPLVYGGIPVFADIEESTFCINPQSVVEKITSKTRAIIAVNLFGHPAELKKLRTLADSRGIYLIEDAAQSPLATEYGELSGCIGHIGVFSLNRHKHIQTGEGGVCATNDDDLALRVKAIRNHGENIIEGANISDSTNMIGFNFRPTELTAAIGIKQLEKIDKIVDERESIAEQISAGLRDLKGLTVPQVREGCRNVYYMWASKYDENITCVARNRLAQALIAEGVPIGEGYCRPLYLLPTFQRRSAIGRNGWPFSLSKEKYEHGICPVSEKMYKQSLLTFLNCSYELNQNELQKVLDAFQKVFSLIRSLRN